MNRPLCVDLFCGLGGWAQGFLSEGYWVVGFDIEHHDYGKGTYPGDFVMQDVLTLHGSQFKTATCIVASPPCQAYSYRAMPWSRAKALPPPDNSLFEACFRIQREANLAGCHCECWRCKEGGHCVRCDCFYNTGQWPRYIPMVVENVRGAQKWVGRAKWHHGSFFLWGDVPVLMPIIPKRSVMKRGVTHRGDGSTNFHSSTKVPGFRFDGSGGSFQSAAVKVAGLDWSKHGEPGYRARGFNVTAAQRYREGVKQSGISGVRNNGKGDRWFQDGAAKHGSKSDSRKAASAEIAKIPGPLARHIARVFKESFSNVEYSR